MKKLLQFLPVVFLVLTFQSCSNNDDDDSSKDKPTDPDLPFQLFSDDYFTSGYSATYELTGGDTLGGTHIGTLLISTGLATTFNGESAIPIDLLIEITNTKTNAFFSASLTSYFSTDANNRLYLGEVQNDTGIINLPTSNNDIPVTATIGDFGHVGNYTGSDGDTMSVNWRLENANNGLANFVITFNYYDSMGDLDSIEEHQYTIDTSGDRLAFLIRATTASFVFTLSGDRV